MKIWIDTDIGGDIDDALALLLAMSDARFKLVGVSTVFENTLKRAKIAKTILSLGGRNDVPVYAGIGQPERATSVHTLAIDVNNTPKTYEESVFGNAKIDGTDAVEALKNAIEKEGGLNVFTLGALTNIAALIDRYPETAKKLRLYIMGGAISMNLNEFNFTCDPEAAAKVLAFPVPKKIVSLDVTFPCELTDEQIARLGECKSKAVKTVIRMSALWGHGMILHDPLTVGVAIGDFVEFAPGNLEVELSGKYSRGKCVNLCDFNWHAAPREDMLVPVSVKSREFCDFYVDKICELDAYIINTLE